MEPWALKHAGDLSKVLLVAGFVSIGAWETLRRWRPSTLPTGKRWLLNALFWILSGVFTAPLFRLGAVALAAAVSGSPYGVLNRLWAPFAVRAVLALLLLDLIQYADHYLRHAIPVLWRFHQLHHADRDLDLSTGVRVHPGEMIFTQGMYLLAIAVTAPPVLAVLCFEVCNIAQALFSHANVRVPTRLEAALRWVQVTPQMHRIHHSVEASDQRANLAVIFSFWDRLFGTYLAVPKSGEDRLEFGLAEVSGLQSLQPLTMLALPFAARPRMDAPVETIHAES